VASATVADRVAQGKHRNNNHGKHHQRQDKQRETTCFTEIAILQGDKRDDAADEGANKGR
jgi:hypothetical protein